MVGRGMRSWGLILSATMHIIHFRSEELASELNKIAHTC